MAESSAESYEVIVLFDGYSKKTHKGLTANCTCTLILGPKKIIVDTMTAWDGEKLVEALKHRNIECDDIDFVVCSHGHSDHIGCNYLFKKAMHIVGHCISYRDVYFDHDFNKNEYVIDTNVKVIATPGHTLEDVSVIVRTEHKGTIVITGDLFENVDDLEDDRIWRELTCGSEELQLKNRNLILQIANYIVPGHGAMFKNKKYIKCSNPQHVNFAR